MIKNCLIPNKKNSYKPYLLRKVAILFYSFLLVFVNSFGGFLGIDEVSASSITPSNIIALTNAERSGMGLNTLNQSSQLSAAALAKANDMFEKQYWDHFGPNGETPWQFIRAAGYNYVYAGENLAKGFKTSEGVHEAWMASPTHRANIVSSNYKDIGVAVVEGVLLGKQTTLVVQMFGNLTNDTFVVTTKDKEVKQSTTQQSTQQVVVNKEKGEIKSIRIISPKDGSVITDPKGVVKGEVSNVSGSYSVDVLENGSVIGSVDTSGNSWEVSKEADWSEGVHKIKANIKGTGVYSSESTFTLDSKSPQVVKDSLQVKKEGGMYTLTFAVDGTWNTVKLVLGSEVKDVDYKQEESTGIISFDINEGDVKGNVSLLLGDSNGNTSQLDISEYFDTDEDNQKIIFPILRIDTGSAISIGIVSFILVLLLVEVFVYWRKGRLREAAGDLFTVGAWWFVITIALFNGFSGSIN